MYSILSYKFRIDPDEKRRYEIDEMLLLAQRLYNKILEKAKAEYERDKNAKINDSTLNRYMKEAIEENKDFLKLYSQTRQDVFVRLKRAFQNFFRRVKEKKEGKKVKVGFPRFKAADRYRSLTYPQDNGSFRIDKEKETYVLWITSIGRVRIELHRGIEGKIKRMAIKREAGEYYAIFTTVKEIDVKEVKDTNLIGIDLGLHSFIAMSDETKIEKPKFMDVRKERIARWQRKVSKRNKGSRRRNKAKLKLQKEWEKVTKESNDFMHKLSHELVNSKHASFAVEKLNIANMVKRHNLAQAIYNASWNRFVQMLSYKAASAGMRVVEVDAAYSTQECSNCGNVKRGNDMLTLDDRIYHCDVCGMTMDRDIKSAIVMKKRAQSVMLKGATAGPAGSNAQEDDGQYIPPGNASRVEELRTYHATGVAWEAPTFR